MKKIGLPVLLLGALTASAGDGLVAGNQPAPDTHYGFLNGLDYRSSYGQGVFPEPFLVDDSDLETGEYRLDWLHTAAGGDHADVIKAEIEYGIGLLTLELEVPYERDAQAGMTTQGLANINVGARYPFFQVVSPNGLADSTFGAAAEFGIPTTSELSQNPELVPKIFNDSRAGRFTLQSVFGYSMLYGPGEDGGLNTFEYGYTLGYELPRTTLRVPGVEKLILVFESSGETALNHDRAGQNNLIADAGLRANLKTIGRLQPRPGITFVFPLDNGAREEIHWGIMTSLVFEF